MKYKEACELLGVSEDVTPEDAKKRYRQLSKEMHPDVNKAPDATDKFKKINEAYSIVSAGKKNDYEEIGFNPFSGIDFGFGFPGQQNQRRVTIEEIHLNETISFKESVLGCKKELKFNRRVKCQDCDGEGTFKINNGCKECGGRGVSVQKKGNMIFSSTCTKCHGRTQSEQCKKCVHGGINSEVAITVSIPAGIYNDNVLRLGGMGHFAQTFLGIEQHSDAFIHLKVIPEEGLSLIDGNVVSTLDVSLLEALEGASKEVKTIFGEKQIDIKPLSKNKDEVLIKNHGVAGKTNQIVILNIQYPKDIDKLIYALKE